MRFSNRFYKVITTCVIMVMIFGSSVFAEPAKNQKAETLKKLNLLKGDNLSSSFTKAQGVVMLLRLLGLESAADKAKLKSRFKDVAGKHWAEKYIAYAVQNGYVESTGSTTFSPDKEITGKQFIAYALRVLGYKEATSDTAVSLSVSSKLLSNESAKALTSKAHFLRSDMVEVAYSALKTKLKSKDISLIEVLIDNKVIDKKSIEDTDLLPDKDPLTQIEDAISKKIEESGVKEKKR